MTYRENCLQAWEILPDELRLLIKGAIRSHRGLWRLE
jgi:hypothetical protein